MVKHSPEDPLSYLNYSLFHFRQKELPKAVEKFKKFQDLILSGKKVDSNVSKKFKTTINCFSNNAK